MCEQTAVARDCMPLGTRGRRAGGHVRGKVFPAISRSFFDFARISPPNASIIRRKAHGSLLESFERVRC